ncbi:MAG: hypothetical protein IKF69_12050, partial [Exiguobacterium sp.]|nr:hypothetical protein [Exiguobacterium sp.]
TTMEGKVIHAGDYMGLFNKDIVALGTDKLTVVKELLGELVDDESGSRDSEVRPSDIRCS